MTPHEIEAEVDRLTDEGTELMSAGDVAAAAERFGAALALDPTHALSWYNLGVTQEETGDQDAAFESYSKAVEHDPGFVNAWNNIGFWYLSRGFDGAMFERAIAEADRAFDIAIEANPDYAKSYNGKGAVCVILGDTETARTYFRMALERDPTSAVARASLRNLDESEEDFRP